MQFRRGDKVCEHNGTVEMTVLAASDVLALCAHDENGLRKQSVFPVATLRRAGGNGTHHEPPARDRPERPDEAVSDSRP